MRAHAPDGPGSTRASVRLLRLAAVLRCASVVGILSHGPAVPADLRP